MSENSLHPDRPAQLDDRSPWVIDTRELGRRAGLSREVRRTVPVEVALGVPGVISIEAGSAVELDLLLESVVEGVLVSGTASATANGACARCLDPVTELVEVDLTELFAYPGSATEETTDEDEIPRLVDDRIDLEPTVRDAVVLALPLAPLCQEDCAGLCTECGVKWADLEPGHGHEKIDPRWAALVDRFDDENAGDKPAHGSGEQA
ncbi:YceD family protein [Amycolatopsis sp. PS_44_ISF1]|uniref:YceD family protein n=1 Tax=Amycolatopsis sp. PS_44_ISF1 TaxID=2974917 RepID=UPI0028DF925E|nr:YceD family protein [Amycolatopsis sp. PS_44_ISF1]MDT8915593.1 YceD family protein [Amycolatopsis sp. PS_44_ISF1]